jgi:hypothetical protein
MVVMWTMVFSICTLGSDQCEPKWSQGQFKTEKACEANITKYKANNKLEVNHQLGCYVIDFD